MLFSIIGGVRYMITLRLGSGEFYDDLKNEFVYEEGVVVRFEYSLRVVYDWEARWRKPFLKGGLTEVEHTEEQLLDFYKRMALDPIDEKLITAEVMNVLAKYITEPQTATTFSTHTDGQNGNKTPGAAKVYTAEEIYALMFEAGIALEWENRNLSRLMVILKIISTHNSPPKKMSKQDVLRQNKSLNAQRKAKLNTKG